MAYASTQTVVRPIRFARNLYGPAGEAPILTALLNTSQTVLAGDMLIASSNRASRAGDDATLTSILGIAAADATSGAAVTDADVVQFYPALRGMIFVGHLTVDAIAETDATAAAADLLVSAGIQTTTLGSATAGYALERDAAAAVKHARVIAFSAQQVNKGASTFGDFIFHAHQNVEGVSGLIDVDGIVGTVINPLVEFYFLNSFFTDEA